jgi:hypothetical protein
MESGRRVGERKSFFRLDTSNALDEDTKTSKTLSLVYDTTCSDGLSQSEQSSRLGVRE